MGDFDGVFPCRKAKRPTYSVAGTTAIALHTIGVENAVLTQELYDRWALPAWTGRGLFSETFGAASL
jgi:hypothetical protein